MDETGGLNKTEQSWTLVGAGNMGAALAAGWLKTGFLNKQQLIVIDTHPSDHLKEMQAQYGFKLLTSVTECPPGSVQQLILAVKPQGLAKTAPELLPILAENAMILSILAGTPSAKLAECFGRNRTIIRAMPNLGVQLGCGLTAIFSDDPTASDHAEALLRPLGPVLKLSKESEIDSISALSGSGPAYAFYLAQSMADAGEKLGLPRDVAQATARNAVIVAGRLLEGSDASPAILRSRVTSPGGTTAAALRAMQENDFALAVGAAIEAATLRSEEMNKKS